MINLQTIWRRLVDLHWELVYSNGGIGVSREAVKSYEYKRIKLKLLRPRNTFYERPAPGKRECLPWQFSKHCEILSPF